MHQVMRILIQFPKRKIIKKMNLMMKKVMKLLSMMTLLLMSSKVKMVPPSLTLLLPVAPDEIGDQVVIDGDILVSKKEAAIYHNSGWNGLNAGGEVQAQAWNPYTRRWRRIIHCKIHKSLKGTCMMLQFYAIHPWSSLGTYIYKNLICSMNEIKRKTRCVKFKRVSKLYRFSHLYFMKGARYNETDNLTIFIL